MESCSGRSGHVLDHNPHPARGRRAPRPEFGVRGKQAATALCHPAGRVWDISLKKGENHNEFVAWCNRTIAPYNPSTLWYRGRIYVLYDRGLVARFDRGRATRFTSDDDCPVVPSCASPWASHGKVFCLSEDGDTFVLRAGISPRSSIGIRLRKDDMGRPRPRWSAVAFRLPHLWPGSTVSRTVSEVREGRLKEKDGNRHGNGKAEYNGIQRSSGLLLISRPSRSSRRSGLTAQFQRDTGTVWRTAVFMFAGWGRDSASASRKIGID